METFDDVGLLSLSQLAEYTLGKDVQSGTIKTVFSGTVAEGTFSSKRWALVAGDQETDSVRYVRPANFNVVTNARVWVNTP